MKVVPTTEDEEQVAHYQDHEEKNKYAVVVPPHTLIDKETVMVVVLDAHVTQTAVFAVVHLDQLTVNTESVWALVGFQ